MTTLLRQNTLPDKAMKCSLLMRITLSLLGAVTLFECPLIAQDLTAPPTTGQGQSAPGPSTPNDGQAAGPTPTTPAQPERGDYEFEKRGGVVYTKSDQYRLTCDIYVPEIEGPLPAVLVVHGGGWRAGSKIHWIRHAWKLAKHGYVVVAINYRHAPKDKFPAQIHDVKQAVRFMKKHAQRYKIDSDRIGAYGYSAGGHLVSLLATTDADDGLEGEIPKGYEAFSDTRIEAVVAGGAPTEFTWLGKDSTALNYWLGDGVTINRNPEIFQRAYPTTYITSDDPPFFFYHGTMDLVVPLKAAKVMHEKLLDAKLSSQFIEYEGSGHFGLFSKTGEPLDRIIEFFDLHLAKQERDE